MAALSKARAFLDHSNTRMAGSNPTRDMDICPSFYILCSVWTERG